MKVIYLFLIFIGIGFFVGCDDTKGKEKSPKEHYKYIPMEEINSKKPYELVDVLEKKEKDNSKKEDKSK